MIQARLHSGGGKFLLTVRGHATGNEAVCAGVSAIVYALLGWCRNFPEHAVELNMEMKSGDAVVRFRGDALAGVAFDVAAIGLLQIEKAHPQNISVELETT